MHKVFVYGTLKRGYPNFHINNGNQLQGTFTTKHRYPLYLVGERYVPWLILNQGQGFQVKGEVFHVDDTSLAEMDRLEQLSKPDGYRRVEIEVISEDTKDEFMVYVYGKKVALTIGADIRQELDGEYLREHTAHYRSRNELD